MIHAVCSSRARDSFIFLFLVATGVIAWVSDSGVSCVESIIVQSI